MMFSRAAGIKCFILRRGSNSFRTRCIRWQAPQGKGNIHTVVGVLVASFLGVGLVYAKEKSHKNDQDDRPQKIFSSEEVSKHNSMKNGIWVTYKGSVYDITEFVCKHPGGIDMITLASGSSVDQYFSLYPVHQNPSVLKILEKYRIGSLVEQDIQAMEDTEDPYRNDPPRDPSLIHCSIRPFIAESNVDRLMENYITPNELHYARNHMPVPIINEGEYQLSLSGKGAGEIQLSLEDIKTKFKKHTFASTLICAGNRCKDMNKARKILGFPGRKGYISTSVWGGALLRDVLEYAGLDEQAIESHGIQHVQFEGLDVDIADTPYAASIPVYKAMDGRCDVLLAYEMNGEPLPLDHGFPVRIIAPGIAGCRSVKWLGKITLSEQESDSFWQQKAYKGTPPNIGTESLDMTPFPAIQEYPVTSAICYPRDNQTLCRKDYEDGTFTVKGYAWSGGGRAIIRVDLSIDSGNTWTVADLKRREQPPGRQWAWTFWECDVTVPRDLERLELVCKAVDSSYNVQPEHSLPIWNPRGYLSHAWDRVNIRLEN